MTTSSMVDPRSCGHTNRHHDSETKANTSHATDQQGSLPVTRNSNGGAQAELARHAREELRACAMLLLLLLLL